MATSRFADWTRDNIKLRRKKGANVSALGKLYVKQAKASHWETVYRQRLKPAEEDFAERYAKIVRAIQKDTVSSGELRNLKRWKKRLADEFEPWYLDQVDDARAFLAKQLKKRKVAAFFRTKAKRRDADWDWSEYEYGTVEHDGTVTIDVDRMVEDHLDVLTGTLDTMDERIDRAIEASPEGLTAEDVERILDGEFDAILEGGHIEDIATTEASWAENAGRTSEMAERGIDWHEWGTAQDDKVRETHVTYGKQGAVPFGTNFAQFEGGDYLLRWPHDPECEEVGEVANCRCISLPAVSPEDATEEEVAALLGDLEADEEE